MPTLHIREFEIPFPPGDNTTDTIINGTHFNTTSLSFWNYTLYSNATLSNNSKCYLTFEKYIKPAIFLPNGTWLNATTCYVPIYDIRTRGWAGIVFAAVWAASIMFTLLNLRKHGQQFLREDKRFQLVGRRWQWYWMIFVAACGIISCVTSVDVDRDYLQDIAIVLQSLFFYLMLPGALAMVWEGTRHWGSWQERQIYDHDPNSLPFDDRRAQTEFWLPLVFYLFAWLNFFMIIPRGWTAIEKQHTLEQQNTIARRSGTDIRHKAGSIMAILAWFVIIFSLMHSMKHYKSSRSKSRFGPLGTFSRECPVKLLLTIAVLAVRLAYGVASAWFWDISILKYDSNPVWFFALGYGPILLIILIFNVAGYIDPNEDRELMRQRAERGRAADRELGIVKKPAWWSKFYGDGNQNLSPEDRLKALASQLPDGSTPRTGATSQSQPQSQPQSPYRDQHGVSANLEMRPMGGDGADVRNRSRSRPPEDPFRDQLSDSGSEIVRTPHSRPDASRMDTESDAGSTMTGLTGMTLTSANAQPQRIRSMLDV